MSHPILSPTKQSLAVVALFGLIFLGSGASAVPVLYRVDSFLLTSALGNFPDPVHFPPVSMPTSPNGNPTADARGLGLASVMTNGTQPASVVLPGGDVTYHHTVLIPTPPTAFGIFYSDRQRNFTSVGGTFAPNPAAAPYTVTPDGFPTQLPWFPTTGAQAFAQIKGKVGAAKFGGVFDMGQTALVNNVVAKLAGGFRAATSRVPSYHGIASPTFNIVQTPPMIGHATSTITNASFSLTVCPTSPATCPWAATVTPTQVEFTGGRWTTGTVTGIHPLPPITFLPPTWTTTAMGQDNRSGPNSSMGTLQMVSVTLQNTRGSFDIQAAVPGHLKIDFLPEPGATLALVIGMGGLFAMHRREERGRRRHTD